MQKVYVASTNPAKIQAAKNAFEKTWPDEEFIFQGFSSPSGVSDQPLTSEETLLGAKNRAAYLKENYPDGDYFIGLEGGLEKRNENMELFAWIVIHSTSRYSEGRSGSYALPPKVTALIDQGYELGEADDIVFQKQNSKHHLGSVGILTDGLLDRISYYEHAVILALIPHRNPEHY